MENNLELTDIQGFILKGYSRLPIACYKFLQIRNAQKAKLWLSELKLTPALKNTPVFPQDIKVNIGISYYGLEALGLPHDVIKSFAVEFLEYPLENEIKQHNLRILGDIGKNSPAHWEWGGTNEDRQKIHVLLMFFAPDKNTLEEVCSTWRQHWEKAGLQEVYQFLSESLPHEKEHFGFRDGISQPEVEGYTDSLPSENVIKAGEFILGYQNEYNRLPETPLVALEYDKQNILPTYPQDEAYKDLGKNGSYLVFRQLEQDVKGFWTFIHEATQQLEGYDMERLGAKIVGRWRSGAPITEAPFQDNPALANFNDIHYAPDDKKGLKCPIGAHIRRTNPRDTFLEDAEKAVAFSRKHRLMRRGRPYGVPFVEDFDLKKILEKSEDNEKRGLYFLAINTNFSRQFNFIQQTWVQDGSFQGLSHEPDALLGSQAEVLSAQQTYFSMPEKPFRQRIKTTESFVRVRGSMNFFIPSMKAIQWIAHL